MVKTIVIGVAIVFAVILGYYSCEKSGKAVAMCEKRGGCWNHAANECEFENLSKCR